MRSYEAARSLFTFLGYCAWFVIISGGIFTLMGIAAINEMSSYGRSPSGARVISTLLPGMGVAFLGFVGLALVQLGRAAVDTAEYTQQMLQIARDQLDVSQQALRGKFEPPQSFAAQVKDAKGDSAPPPATFAEKLKDPPETPKAEALERLENSVEYRGKVIEEVDGKFLVDGKSYKSLRFAEKHVDRVLK